MCVKTGVLLAKLPLYSCDFNPKETSFLFIKSYIRRNSHMADSYSVLQRRFKGFLRDIV